MPLREEMIDQGEVLFKRRGSLPSLLLPILAVAILIESQFQEGPISYSLWLRGIGIGICLAGLLVRAIAIGRVPKRTSGRRTKEAQAETLNTEGMYSLCRHPLYLGNYLCFLGPWIAGGDWRIAALYTVAFWVFYERVMLYEEEYLRGKFGETYLSWSKHTPAFFPRLSSWKRPTRAFSWRMLFRREPTAWLGVCVGFIAVRAVLEIARIKEFRLDSFEVVTLTAFGVIYVIARVLRKHTTVLALRDVNAIDTEPAGAPTA